MHVLSRPGPRNALNSHLCAPGEGFAASRPPELARFAGSNSGAPPQPPQNQPTPRAPSIRSENLSPSDAPDSDGVDQEIAASRSVGARFITPSDAGSRGVMNHAPTRQPLINTDLAIARLKVHASHESHDPTAPTSEVAASVPRRVRFIPRAPAVTPTIEHGLPAPRHSLRLVAPATVASTVPLMDAVDPAIHAIASPNAKAPVSAVPVMDRAEPASHAVASPAPEPRHQVRLVAPTTVAPAAQSIESSAPSTPVDAPSATTIPSTTIASAPGRPSPTAPSVARPRLVFASAADLPSLEPAQAPAHERSRGPYRAIVPAEHSLAQGLIPSNISPVPQTISRPSMWGFESPSASMPAAAREETPRSSSPLLASQSSTSGFASFDAAGEATMALGNHVRVVFGPDGAAIDREDLEEVITRILGDGARRHGVEV